MKSPILVSGHSIKSTDFLQARVFNEAGGEDLLVAGYDSRMRSILEAVAKVAPTVATVLIGGESGTGKDLIARLVHQCSPRRDGAWVPVNCGAIPASLVESELFGAMRGAFTGADRDTDGLIASAKGGTLFLDEIGELPLDAQVKLLRFLQTGRARAVGAIKDRHVDVRVIAATNRDLRTEVEEGRFRLDLFYRIHVIHLELPALRQRKADLPPIVSTVVERLRSRGVEGGEILPGALSALSEHDWPGNIRELENVVERLLLLSGGAPVTAELVREQVSQPRMEVHSSRPGEDCPERSERGYSLSMSLREVEDAHIRKVLDHHGGNKTRAAKDLGVNVKTIYNRMVRAQEKVAGEGSDR
ncbi:MAG TPA: sigma-54-dependent Fis family transcriptional regulator [Planctomycetes bacterium]|nr:sigma-54-dependent Fis family transcriptional regulator [Planctomycetota bacterium]